MNSLPNYPSFDVEADKSNAGTRWEKWLSRLENLFVGLKINDDKQKRALLLHYAGEKVFDIYDVEKSDTEEQTYNTTKKVLNDYFAPKKNVQIEIFNFRTYRQKDDQTLDEFVTELRNLARNCEFTNVDAEILQQVIQNCKSNQLRRRALREPDKGLSDILTIGRMLEQSERQALIMESAEENVTKITKGKGKPHYNRDLYANERSGVTGRRSNKSRERKTANNCRNCGYEFPHLRGPCPAKGKTCNYCKRVNHFSRCCREKTKQRVREVSEEVQSDSETLDYSYGISVKSICPEKTPTTRITMNGKQIKGMIDTGSSVNIVDEKTYASLGKPKLRTKRLPKLLPYGGGPTLGVIGCFDVTAEKGNKIVVTKFFVVKGNHGTLFSYQTAIDLGLIQITQNITTIESVEEKFQGIFKGIGKLKDQTVKLHINPDIKPVAQTNRRTPFHLRKKVEKEIGKLLRDDIIEEVRNESTPWVSPIVTPPKKNGDVRLCVDMREANKAIERERHQLPTIDELIHDLNGATVFSKLDLKSGYNQLVLDESSRSITTFSTHMGLYRFKRLNFGTNSASEVFQKTISSVIQGIQNAKNISDDILIFGKDQKEHDLALNRVFQALHRNGLTLNKEKCEFNKTDMTFFGVVFRASGISPDPVKVESIQSMVEPTNVSELRSFLGLTAYCSRFIKNYASVTEPLRILTRKDTEWIWEERQQKSFNKLKEELSSETVMTYYDPGKNIELITDASPVGLSGILTQKGKVIAYASRALTKTESRYSQTEREALAIVWSCEHYNMYLKGAPCFTVVTDHKPLTTIWKKKQPPLRIERWGLRLQPYKMNIVYKPGKDNPSDYMSRHPVKYSVQDRNLAEEYVSFICENAVPNAMTMDEVKYASQNDKTIQKAIELTKSGRWHELKTIKDRDVDIEDLLSMRNVKDELTVYCETVLLRNDRIVVPKCLRQKAVKLGHEGHQGVTKTKSYVRSKVWFPNLGEEIENEIKGCMACQANTKDPKPNEPLKMSEMPSGPWQNLSADFCGPLDTGEYLFVVIDEYSRYPVVEIVKSVSVKTVIPVLDKIISTFGIPTIIKSDNGSPFNSKDFADYARHIGFVHRKVTPCWPKANAQAESFNKPLMKSIRSACVEGKSWRQELYRFLRQYRATPHTSTGFTPFRLLFQREPKTRLPIVSRQTNDKKIDELARQTDEKVKSKSKSYQDNKSSEKQFKVGDKVLIKNENKTKMTCQYKPVQYRVTDKKGTMLTVENNGHSITRNSSFMKKIPDNLDGNSKMCKNQIEVEDISESLKENDTGQENSYNERPKRERRVPKYLDDYVLK